MFKKFLKMRSSHPVSFWFVLGILIVFLIWILKFYYKSAAAPNMQGGFAMPVEASPVARETIYDDIITVGSLRANEFVIIRPEIEGRVVEFYFQEGQKVAQGDLLLRLDDHIAAANVAETEAYLSLSDIQNQRQKSLYSNKFTSGGEKDKAESKLKADRAIFDRRKSELAKTKIYAPFAGVLGLRQVSPGDYLKPGQEVISLVSLDPIKIEFSVPEVYAPRLKSGQKVEITSEALPGKKFEGEIYALDPVINESGRSIKARGKLANKDFSLKPGMFVRLRVRLAQRNNALLIPEEAIVSQDQEHFIYKVQSGKALKVPVQLGARLRGKVEVLEGVTSGDQVITAGQIKIGNGMPVQVVPVQSTPEPKGYEQITGDPTALKAKSTTP